MPDGDVVYHEVGRFYRGAYRELCEGYFPDEHITASIVRGLRKTLKRYGNSPITLISRTFDSVSGAIGEGVPVEYDEASHHIDLTARELMGHRRGMPLAIDACKDFVLTAVSETRFNEALKDVIRNYVSRALRADFLERMPLVNHHANADPEIIEKRLIRIQPLLDKEVEIIASRIAKAGKVDQIRQKRHSSTAQQSDFEHMDVSFPDTSQEEAHVSD